MAADKQLGFEFKITGITVEQQEIAKLEMALKNLRKEKDAIMKSGKLVTQDEVNKLAALNKEIATSETTLKGFKKTVDAASDSLVRKKQRLIELKQLYEQTSEAHAKRLAPEIKKFTDDITKAEAAVGVHSRGVGNYKQSILNAGKELIGFTSITALVVTAVMKLKEAFAQTDQGVKFFTTTANQFKALFQGIISGEGLVGSFKNAILAAAPSKELDKLRREEREEMVRNAAAQKEIILLRIEAAKASKDSARQVELLTLAQKKEDEIIERKKDHLEKQIKALKELSATRKNDSDLLDLIAQKEAELENVQAEKSVRLASKREAAENKVVEEAKKAAEQIRKIAQDEYDYKENLLKAEEKMRKLYFDKWKQMVEDEKNFNTESFKKGLRDLLGIKPEDLGLQHNKELEQNIKKGRKTADDADLKETKEIESKKLDAKLAGIQGAEMGAAAAFEARKNRLQAEMTAELSNQNLTEAQKLSIQKKYAREQQKMDVARALIDGALAIARIFATVTPINPLSWWAVGVAAMQTALQVVTIKAQKFATGGRIQGGFQVHSDTSRDNTLIYAKQGETVLTQRHVAMLGGSGAMRNIGVPGYAMGGYIGSQAPEIPAQGQDFKQVINALRNLQIRLDINKVNKAQNELEIINQTQRI